MKDFWLIIPTYNEADNIGELIKRLCGIFCQCSILVVDDNSPDGTADLVRQTQKQFENIYLLVRPGKLGLGSAYQTGFTYALEKGALVVGQMDADFSHAPEDLFKLIDKIESGYEVVIGSRRVRGGGIVGWGWWRCFTSYSANALARKVLSLKTKDVTAGFRLYSRSALLKIDWVNIKSNGYAWQEEILFLCEKAGLKVAEVPVLFVDRERGKSKLGLSEVFNFFKVIIKLVIK
ncbi:polyprenol monophosphomannose synthase [Patescibacteria group bacterium]|nr:polyprenol monophosphomannose synthase [Patescibacteria group bacterium]